MRADNGSDTSEKETASQHEVAALARVLNGLMGAVSATLGETGPLKYGTIAVPNLPALYNEDLLDAAHFVGFELILGRPAHPEDNAEEVPLHDLIYTLEGMDHAGKFQ
ncbi:hypothetical protein CB0940_03562 [Cercospora beticola]|uniref:Uncharacterized protein n=1 Tax=Cercospora beticola TaxID=122368 RepID=A0A2G5I3Q2_CERBT|nr:hypothetical protein CB0940_03562 [Cercospora beticola]PIA99400.1 hypothetical protein CB0940_03562 [Cercospora beticola]WPB00738.1 hypothetical protein RHO25_005358 [Cercospora beticola]CAK1361028.1 unnamed protein product [Cercospora beticola]